MALLSILHVDRGLALTYEILPAALLHWFTSPYVRRLVFNRTSQTLELHTWSVFARPQVTRIHLSEVRYPDTLRPQVTFQVSFFAVIQPFLHCCCASACLSDMLSSWACHAATIECIIMPENLLEAYLSE